VRIAGRANRRVAMSLWERDGGICGRCTYPIDPTLHYTLPGALTIGHVKPLSLGGSNLPPNLRAEHRSCNLDAGARVSASASPLDPQTVDIKSSFSRNTTPGNSRVSARNGAGLGYLRPDANRP